MMIRRRKKPNNRSVMVRFQPWLIAGGVVLNVVATVSAALSAYYTSEQSELAISAVNQQSRNEAFSELVKAAKEICTVSLGKADQTDWATFGEGRWYVPIDYDQMRTDVTDADISALVDTYRQRVTDFEDRLAFFSIWASDDEYNNVIAVVDGRDGRLNNAREIRDAGMPPQAVVVVERTKCNQNVKDIIRLQKKEITFSELVDLEGYLRHAPIVPVPYSQQVDVRGVMFQWGLQGEIEQAETQSLIPSAD